MRRQVLATSIRHRSPVEVMSLNARPASYAQYKAMRSHGPQSKHLHRPILTPTHQPRADAYGLRTQPMSSYYPAVQHKPNCLVVFDKDGTLIDFQAMWRSFVESLAWTIEKKSNMNLREKLFEVLGYDSQTRKILSDSRISDSTLPSIFQSVVSVVQHNGLSAEDASRLVKDCWKLPDPKKLAKPTSDLVSLFSKIRGMGAKIAVVTLDDRGRTEALLSHLGVGALVDGVACGDDEVPVKPNPEQIWALCRSLKASPSQTIVVGDTKSDMVLAKQAGCALSVGVMTGSTAPHELAREADVLLPSLDNVLQIVAQYAKQPPIYTSSQ